MNELLDILNQHPATRALILSLFHSLWQGPAIAGLLWLLLKLAHQLNSATRHLLAFTALCSLLLCFLCTFYIQFNSPVGAIAAAETSAALPLSSQETGQAAAETSLLQTVEMQWHILAHWVQQHVAYFFLAWIFGSIFFSLRFFTGLHYLRSLKQESSPFPAAWTEKVKALTDTLGLHKEIRLLASDKVNTPLTFGWLKPVIVFPLSMLSLLPEDQVESILLHELAHIRRNDYLTNLLQSLIEIIFFFNPGYWYLSKVIEREREHVCDDMVVSHSANAHTYARALTNLAELTYFNSSPLALNVARKESSLFFRIKRIIHPSKTEIMEKSIKKRSCQLASLLIACTILLLFTLDVSGNSGSTTYVDSQEAQAAATEKTMVVEGTVKDTQGGSSLPGASVRIKGSNTGTTTDRNGNFRINAKADDTLVIAFVGFQRKEVAINSEPYHVISLKSTGKPKDNTLVILDLEASQKADEEPEAPLATPAEAPPAVPEAAPTPEAFPIVEEARIFVIPEDQDIKAFMEYTRKEEVQITDIQHQGRGITMAEYEALDKSDLQSNLTLSSVETGHKKAVTLVKLKNTGDKAKIVSTKAEKPQPLFIVLIEEIFNSTKAEPEEYKAAMASGRQVSDPKDIKPESIASMHVLKDSKITAQLGDAGKNGVIFITLKKQEESKAEKPAGRTEETFTVFPNPSDDRVSVRFFNAAKQQVTLEALAPDGTKAHTFVNEVLDKGWHQYEWNASKQRAGLYSITLKDKHTLKTRKLVLK